MDCQETDTTLQEILLRNDTRLLQHKRSSTPYCNRVLQILSPWSNTTHNIRTAPTSGNVIELISSSIWNILSPQEWHLLKWLHTLTCLHIYRRLRTLNEDTSSPVREVTPHHRTSGQSPALSVTHQVIFKATYHIWPSPTFNIKMYSQMP